MSDRHLAVWPAHVPQHLELPQTCLYTNLAISALRYPERNALIYYDTPITYRQLKQEVDQLAGWLQSKGVQQGDRVLLFMQNAPQFIIGYYAILRANAVVVPVNPMNRQGELAHYLEDTEAAVCLCGQELFPALAPLLGQVQLRDVLVAAYNDYIHVPTDLDLPDEVRAAAKPISGTGVTLWRDALAAALQPGELLAKAQDLAVMPYSSGTTGAPKGCMHSHYSVMATAVQGAVWTHVHQGSVVLASLPYFHVTGMQGSMNTPIYSGATIVLMTRWNRRVAAELIHRHRITRWQNIVTMVIDFLADPEVERYDLSSLKSIAGGGAAMPGAVSDKLMALTGLRYVEGYGLSETIAGTHINPSERPKTQCLGIPVCDVDSRILDPDSGKLLDAGETGEIIIHGPQVFQGYWNLPEDTEKAFIEFDGKRFLRTGDLGYFDEEGYFFLVDRIKRMINASGFKVWPAEVESMLYRHPAIREACIISTPHPRRGETVKACLILKEECRDSVSADDIIAWCREQMASYKVPQQVTFVDTLPRTPSGKIMWRTLQEQEWAQAKQETA